MPNQGKIPLKEDNNHKQGRSGGKVKMNSLKIPAKREGKGKR